MSLCPFFGILPVKVCQIQMKDFCCQSMANFTWPAMLVMLKVFCLSGCLAFVNAFDVVTVHYALLHQKRKGKTNLLKRELSKIM